MKPILVREQNCLNTSIAFDCAEYDYFYNPLHYHPECELTLVLKSYGQRQIGDNIENFTSGDLVLVGSNLPHAWKNDELFTRGASNQKAQAIVVKFRSDFAGAGFMERPEMLAIRNLIEDQAHFGIKLNGELSTQVADILLKFPQMDDTDRLIQLLLILNIISRSKEYKLLASTAYRNEKVENTHRVNHVLEYIMEHYHEELSLENIASKIGMSRNAFCRFFKNGTRKSLFTIINEVRIGKACQLLAETDMNVLQICFACGFNNISGFNKSFKKYKGTSPLKYRKLL